MTNTTKGCFLMIFLGLESVQAATCVQNDNTLSGLVGLDGSNGQVYAKIESTSSAHCGCTSVRFKHEFTDVNMALSLLLSAKIANQKVRIDLLNEGNCDSAFRVYIH